MQYGTGTTNTLTSLAKYSKDASRFDKKYKWSSNTVRLRSYRTAGRAAGRSAFVAKRNVSKRLKCVVRPTRSDRTTTVAIRDGANGKER